MTEADHPCQRLGGVAVHVGEDGTVGFAWRRGEEACVRHHGAQSRVVLEPRVSATWRPLDHLTIRGAVVQIGPHAVDPERIDFDIAFGGFKQSGVGREGGREGLLPYLESKTVLLDGAPVQIALSQAARGLDRHYRIGAAERGYDDASTVHRIAAFEGIGLRPYRPVHLRIAGQRGADRTLTWIRRTRIDGGGWHVGDVPLGEDREAYLVQVVVGLQVIREVTVMVPTWVYLASQQAADGTLGGCSLRVAQISDRFGPGPFAQLAV